MVFARVAEYLSGKSTQSPPSQLSLVENGSMHTDSQSGGPRWKEESLQSAKTEDLEEERPPYIHVRIMGRMARI